uniref:Uncharacterized protein n=1 Tax=Physcomitrium patens TaxID=3218 RepID=A0A2K1K6H7_PHYPA|nr:hypothetical protein PHYPA_011271 [Physcomitrium patens]
MILLEGVLAFFVRILHLLLLFLFNLCSLLLLWGRSNVALLQTVVRRCSRCTPRDALFPHLSNPAVSLRNCSIFVVFIVSAPVFRRSTILLFMYGFFLNSATMGEKIL